MHVSRHTGLGSAYAAAAAALLLLCGCSHSVEAARSAQAGSTADPAVSAKVHFYQTDVLPVLQRNCLRCHGGMNRRGGLNMSTRAALLQGGKDGAVVLPAHPEDSLLLRVINPKLPESDPMRMPPKGDRLSDADIATIRKWVTDGAAMDR